MPVKLDRSRSTFQAVPTKLPLRSRHWRYLRDRDVRMAGLVSLLVLLLSGGLVWLGYVIHVWRVAVRSPLLPPRRMVTLVFGQRLRHELPDSDYRQRLQRALALSQAGRTDHLLLLGGRGQSQCSEAAAGEAWLRRHGVSDRLRLELEEESSDSLENLRHARQLLQAQAGQAPPPAVALLSSRYHLARCLLLARRLGMDATPVAAEDALPRRPRYLLQLLGEASYLMWIDVGLRWARLVGRRGMVARIS